MPKYEVTGPDGKRYEVDAPEGATGEDAMAYIAREVYNRGVTAPESVQPTEDPGFFSNMGQLLKSGYGQAKAAVEVAPGLAGADMSKRAGVISGALQQEAPEPEQLKEAKTAFKEEAAMIEEAPNWYSPGALKGAALGIAELGKQIVTNPKGAAYMFAEQAANMAPGITGMLVGGVAGGPLGAVAGGFAGQVPVESGSEFISLVGQELANRKLQPTEANVAMLLSDTAFTERASSEARIKGATTAAVDAATTVLGGRVAGGAERAAIKAAKAELGAAATEQQIIASVKRTLAERTLLQNAGRGAAGVGIDVAGGGASEAAGQLAAYGKVDPESVMQEMLGELAGAGVEVPAAARAVAEKVLPKGAELTPEQKTQAEIEGLEKNIAFYDELIPEKQAAAEEVQQRAKDEERELTREELDVVQDYDNLKSSREAAMEARDTLISPAAPVAPAQAEAPAVEAVAQAEPIPVTPVQETTAPVQPTVAETAAQAEPIPTTVPVVQETTADTEAPTPTAPGVSPSLVRIADELKTALNGKAPTPISIKNARSIPLSAATDLHKELKRVGLIEQVDGKFEFTTPGVAAQTTTPVAPVPTPATAPAPAMTAPQARAAIDIKQINGAIDEVQSNLRSAPEGSSAAEQLRAELDSLINDRDARAKQYGLDENGRLPKAKQPKGGQGELPITGDTAAVGAGAGTGGRGPSVYPRQPAAAGSQVAETGRQGMGDTGAPAGEPDVGTGGVGAALTAAPSSIPPLTPNAPTVAGMQQQQANFAREAFSDPNTKLPRFNNKLYTAIMKFLTGPKSVSVKKLYLSALSLSMQAQVFDRSNAKFAGVLRDAEEMIGSMNGELATGRKRIEANLVRWGGILGKVDQKVRDEFGDIVIESTRKQLDVTSTEANNLVNKVKNKAVNYDSLTPYEKELYDLTTRFRALDRNLQRIYPELRKEYIRYSDRLFAQIESAVGTSVAAKLRKEYESNRLMVYFPLFRQPGDFWLSYQDKNNEKVTQSFPNQFERDQLAEKLKRDPANRNITPYSRIEVYNYKKNTPPTGFMTDLITEMSKKGVDDDVINMVYETFLDHLPNKSIRQMSRERQGDLGPVKDPLVAYANVASRLDRHIINMKYDRRLQDLLTQANDAVGGNKPPTVAEKLGVEELENRIRTVRSPNYDWIDTLGIGTGVYYMTMAANVSTSFFNLFSLPMFSQALLAGKYGDIRAAKAMASAFGAYWKNGGVESGSNRTVSWLSDYTFGAKATGEDRVLFNELVRRGVLHSAQNYDIQSIQKTGVEDYVGKVEKGKRIASWTLHNSERATREITALATFKLAREDGKSVAEAVDEAVQMLNDTHGFSSPEVGPTLFRQGLPRVAFMLKRFAHMALWTNIRLLREGLRFSQADKDTARVARRQLARILVTTFLFAGVRGLPVYGAYTVISSLLGWMMSSLGFGDDDEPKDPDAAARKLVGDPAYYGYLNALTGLDAGSRVALSDLIWRDDSDRLEDVGPFLYTIERLTGPAGSLVQNAIRGAGLIKEGHVYRGVEAVSPAVLRNALKSYRYATENAMTKNGDKLIADVDKYQVVMQFLGVAPADVMEANERAGEKYRANKQLNARKKSLYDAAYAAHLSGDMEAMREIEMEKAVFSEKNPAYAITPSSSRQSIQTKEENAAQAVDGLYISEKQRAQLEAQGIGLPTSKRKPVQAPPQRAEPQKTEPQRPIASNKPSTSGVSDSLVNTVKRLEGFRSTPYWDGKQYSYGYGIKAPSKDATITREQAEEDLSDRLRQDREYVVKYGRSKGYNWSQQQAEALTSFVYNLGREALNEVTDSGARSNEAIKRAMLEYVNVDGVPSAGLKKRRELERSMFAGG